MSNIHNSKRFRQQAALLQEQAELHGMTLVTGEAASLLAERLTAVASQLGVTDRTALDRYLSDDFVIALAKTLGEHAASYQEIAAATEPIQIDIPDVGQVLAAVGVVLKLAAEHVEQTQAESMAILTDGADAIVNLGAAVRAAQGAAQIELGGQALVWTRGILVTAIELLRSRQWRCPCPSTHEPESPCRLVPDLTRDLSLVGGWASPDGS